MYSSSAVNGLGMKAQRSRLDENDELVRRKYFYDTRVRVSSTVMSSMLSRSLRKFREKIIVHSFIVNITCQLFT